MHVHSVLSVLGFCQAQLRAAQNSQAQLITMKVALCCGQVTLPSSQVESFSKLDPTKQSGEGSTCSKYTTDSCLLPARCTNCCAAAPAHTTRRCSPG